MTATVTFVGQYAGEDPGAMTVDGSSLTEGDAAVTTTAQAYTPPPGTQLPWRLVVKAYPFSTRVGELSGFTLTRVYKELGGHGAAEFSLPVLAADPALVKAPGNEVEVWHGNSVVFAGPMVRARADRGTVHVQCADPSWYFGRRYIGKADRTNYLANPEFQDSPPGTFPVSWGTGAVTAEVVSSPRILGTQAVRLSQASVDVDTHVHQQVWWNSTGTLGLYVTFVAHFFIEQWIGSAFEERGLFIEVRDATVGNGTSTNPEGRWTHYEYLRINEETPRGVWVRGEVGIHLPPQVTRYSVDARLYAIGGAVVWDATSLTVMESLSYYNTDQATIAQAIVVHLQNPSFDKSTLLLNADTPATGVLRSIHHQHADHVSGLDALNGLVGLRDGLEWDVHCDSATRTFRTHYPRKQNDRSETVHFSVGPNADASFGTVVDFQVEVDGEETANVIVVLGEQEGPDREEGGAKDTTSLGGLTLEKVVFPPAGANIDRLDAIAAASLERYKRPVTVTSVTVYAPHLIDSLQTGDVVSVTIDHGWVQLSGRYRVVAISVDPANETMELTLNDAAVYET